MMSEKNELNVVQSHINKIYELFKSQSKLNYVTPSIPGQQIVDYLQIDKSEYYHFFNLMCYELKVLSINPGTDEVSYHWQENDYGLLEPLRTQLERDIKIDELGI
jgi:hypothetical protein